MAATDLQFSKNSDNRYYASFVSEGAVTIQIKRQQVGFINIYANIDGMDKRYIGGYGDYIGGANVIFSVDVAPGVTVNIESAAEVLSAKMLANG